MPEQFDSRSFLVNDLKWLNLFLVTFLLSWCLSVLKSVNKGILGVWSKVNAVWRVNLNGGIGKHGTCLLP